MDARFHGLKPVASQSEPLGGSGRQAPRIGLPIVGRSPRLPSKRYATCLGLCLGKSTESSASS